MIKFIELFAGIGGFRYGLENVTTCEGVQQGLSQESKTLPSAKQSCVATKQFTCVWANEIDKYACQVYRRNYGTKEEPKSNIQSENSTLFESQSSQYRGHTLHQGRWDERSKLYEGDITKVSTEDIPDHELLVGGVPCQAWSIAGKRKGFEDSRGTMWFECFRIIEAKKPKHLLLENVKGILSHNGGNSFERICESICELGYVIDFDVLNSKNFGVPQNRERVFLIGIREDLLDECQIF